MKLLDSLQGKVAITFDIWTSRNERKKKGVYGHHYSLF